MLHVCGPRWPRRRRLPQQRPRRMDRLCRLCWLPQLLLASLSRVHGELTRGALRWTISSTALPSTPAAIVRSDGGGGLIIILSYYRECCLVYREWE